MKHHTLFLSLSLLSAGLIPSQAADKLNFVFFLVDDLGYMDIGANNPDCFYETPHIDRLAATGMRFTDGYAANPVCSPSRYALMSGKHPSRIDATNFFSGKRRGRFRPAPLFNRMPVEEFTLAESFREAGYRTCFAGKWHLGPSEEFWPKNQGFDVNFGGGSNGLPRSYFEPYKNVRSLEPRQPGEYLTDRLADQVNGFIREQAKNEEAFFVYFSFYNVHTPLQAKKELIEKYREKAARLPSPQEEPEFGFEEQVWPQEGSAVKRPNGTLRVNQPDPQRRVRIRQRHATYAAMVEAMDSAVGSVLETLERLDLSEDTIICFTSDNGGLSTSEGSPTSNLPLRGGKGWTYEGGIREPFLIRWPGVTAPGSVCETPVIGMDFYPTLLEACGLPAKPDQHLDGISLAPLLREPSAELEREALYWHYPHYSNQGGIPSGAIRMGDWKLIERFEDGRAHLYHLAEDPGERSDAAARHPEKVAAMRRRLHAWYEEVDAKFLRPETPDGKMPWRPGDSG